MVLKKITSQVSSPTILQCTESRKVPHNLPKSLQNNGINKIVNPPTSKSSRMASGLDAIAPNEIAQSPKLILIATTKAGIGAVSSLINSGLTIIAIGIKYSPIPRSMAFPAIFNQFSSTIEAAINTAPHTGGVIVESSANQKI